MSSFENSIKKMLPKTYLCKTVAHEISTALTVFKHLVPIMDQYVYNDGTTKKLMCLTGTISAVYKDNTYNIPVCLWLEESYPQTTFCLCILCVAFPVNCQVVSIDLIFYCSS
uniref:UEV domain-containing protein n=1 Tax=Sphaeramia orbicularis TaxID=375764 RepID=A0A673BLL7_9TELE